MAQRVNAKIKEIKASLRDQAKASGGVHVPSTSEADVQEPESGVKKASKKPDPSST